MLHNRVSIREYLRGLRTIDDGGRHTLPLPESSPRAKRNARELVLYPCYTRVIYIYISSYPSSVFLAFPPRTISSSPLLCGQAFEIEGSSPFVVALRLFVQVRAMWNFSSFVSLPLIRFKYGEQRRGGFIENQGVAKR